MRLLCLSLIASLATFAPASAQSRSVCDISGAKCVVNDTKCNIHFRNRTGESGSSKLEQSSAAQAVQVKAIDKGGNRVGNTLVLQVNEKKTMNISKKARKDFAEIRIKSDNAPGMYAGSEISCAEIIQILDGTGTCKLFQGARKSGGQVQGTIGYQCDGGNVGGPG